MNESTETTNGTALAGRDSSELLADGRFEATGPGLSVNWDAEDGPRSVSVFDGKGGDTMFLFKCSDCTTPLRLSQDATAALLALLLERKAVC